ncbi:MATE family efflux transporter [Candidatus Poribacteria bacterium]
MSLFRRDLTEGSIVWNILYLALPAMIGSVFQNTFSLVDMWFVGKLGPSAMAAVGMSGLVLGILFVVIIGVYMGTIALVARFIGAKNQAEAENVAVQSLFLGLFCYAAIAIIGYPLAPTILKMLRAGEDIIVEGVPYIRILFLGSIMMIVGIVLSSVLRAAGDAITPLIILAVSTLLNIALDPLLIFGVWGFPRLGVAGSAWATVIARSIGTLILLWLFLSGRAVIKLRMTDAKVDFPLMWRIIRIGIFASLQGVMRNISGLFLMPIVNTYGTSATAAYTLGMRLRMVVMMPGFGLGSAVSTLVGQNLGAGKPERAERTAWITAGIGFALMASFGIGFIVFSRSIVGSFSADPDVIRTGVSYINVIACTFGFIGLGIIFSRAFSGAGDTISPLIITAIGFVGLRVSLSILLSSLIGLKGVWFGVTISTVVQGLMAAFWFNTGRWKSKKV